jgi:hypothetical protein
MRKLLVLFAVLLLGGFIGGRITAHAQTTVALQLTGNAPHTSCTITASTTTYCFASDGLYWSNAGGTYALLASATTAGVTSLSVNGGTAQTGAVAITVPTAATSTTTTVIK